MIILKFIFICGAILTFASCCSSLKIEVRSTGIFNGEPTAKFAEEILKWFDKTVALVKGHPIELYCKGVSAMNISLNNCIGDYLFYGGADELMKTTIVNDTTSMYLMSAPNNQLRQYYCERDVLENGLIDGVNLLIDSLPQARNFGCVWKFGKINYIICDWNSELPVFGFYKLSVLMDGHPEETCEEKPQDNNVCVLRIPKPRNQIRTFHFHLHSCTYFGCLDEMYKMSSKSILQLEPPIVTIDGEGSNYATVRWTNSVPWALDLDREIEYWMEGSVGFQPVHYSPIEDYINRLRLIIPSGQDNHLRLDLPSAGKNYVVRVRVKSPQANYKYWSEFSSASFSTVPAQDDTIQDPVCSRPDIELNGPVMKYQVQLLRKEVRTKAGEVKKKIPLYEKFQEIKKLLARN